MAYVAPSTVTAGTSPITAAAQNILVNDVIDHESLIGTFRTAPTSWTPTLGLGWSNGNSTTEGRYYKVGLMVWFWGKITLGSTATKSGNFFLSLPVPAASYTDFRLYASTYNFVYEDTGANVYYGNGGDPVGHTSSTLQPTVTNTSGAYAALAFPGVTVPFTWGTGDNIIYSGFYQAAS